MKIMSERGRRSLEYLRGERVLPRFENPEPDKDEFYSDGVPRYHPGRHCTVCAWKRKELVVRDGKVCPVCWGGSE